MIFVNNIYVGNNLYVGNSNGANSDVIYFGGGLQSLAWDTTNNVWQPSGNVFNSSQLASVDSVANLMRSELLANSDSTQFRVFSGLKYLNAFGSFSKK